MCGGSSLSHLHAREAEAAALAVAQLGVGARLRHTRHVEHHQLQPRRVLLERLEPRVLCGLELALLTTLPEI